MKLNVNKGQLLSVAGLAVGIVGTILSAAGSKITTNETLEKIVEQKLGNK